MNQRKIQGTIALPAPRKYGYFVREVASRRSVTCSWSEGSALLQTNDDNTVLFPLWPESVFARLYATGEWSGYEPTEINLDDLFNELIPNLCNDGFKNYRISRTGHLWDRSFASADQSDLREELKRI